MAHDYLRDIVSNWEYDDSFDPVAEAWKYADAMQAEADKREKEEAAQRRKEIREMLNAPNTFVEREGQHFDDVADIQKPYTRSEEWQPDWSQAPDNALTWAINSDGYASWALYKDGHYFSTVQAPPFNYQGDWRNSLRKRPQ